MNECLNPEIWLDLYDLISNEPGLTISQISSSLKMSSSDVQEYLLSMEEKQRIISVEEDGETRFYVRKKDGDSPQQNMIKETYNRIHKVIMENPGIHLDEIVEKTHIKRSVLEESISYMKSNKSLYNIEEIGRDKYFIDVSGEGVRDNRSLDIKRKIYEIISKNPGLHLSKIAQELDMRTSLAEYHLMHMEKNELIVSIKEPGGYYKRYYIKGTELGVEDKQTIALLRHEVPLRIVMYLLQKKTLRHRDLLKDIDVSSSTLSYHINKLIRSNIIEVSTYGDEKGYRVRNKSVVIRLLIKYEIHVVLDDFKDVWADFNY